MAGSGMIKRMQDDNFDCKDSQLATTTSWLTTACFLALLLCFPAHDLQAQALVQNRIVTAIRSDQMQVMKGTVHPQVAMARDEGRLSSSTPIEGMSLLFLRSPAQQADLKKLLTEQQTKGSPMYHQWLRPGQFAARYGVGQHDLSLVAGWLQSQGFQVSSIPPSEDRIDFNGTAAQVEATFHTQMHRYLLRGVPGWANATDISVPQAIVGMTLGIAHLNTFRPLPHVVKRPVYAIRNSTSSTQKSHYTLCNSTQTPCPSGNVVNFLAPADIYTIYDVSGLYNSAITGNGQIMAVVGQTDILQYKSDIANFRTLSGLNAGNLPTQIQAYPNHSGTIAVSPPDLEEADIDVEWSGAVAKDASILYVTVGNNQNYSVFNSLQYAIQTPLLNNNTQFVPVISISYGNCEQAFAGSTDIQALEGYLQQANSQGQTVVAAAGDSGSADCDTGTNSSGQTVAASHGLAVDYPGSSQYVTAAGGTSFSGDIADETKYWNPNNTANNGSAISYIPETSWNDTPNIPDLTNIGGLSAGGGGASACAQATVNSSGTTICIAGFPKPSWQVGNGVPNDSKRDVPDVSLAADANHDGYVLCTEETNSTGTAFTTSPPTSSCVYPVGSGQVPYFDANGQGSVFGGTSIVAPQLAAMITLWNQKAGNTSGVGNANPLFYSTAQNTPGAFHDTTTGSNAVVCQQGSPNCVADPSNSGNYIMSCCNAGSGYDQATGLGSVDAGALAAVWPSIVVSTTNPPQATFSMVPNPGALSIKAGSSATVALVLSPSSSSPLLAGFSGTVNLACSKLPAGVTCSFAPSSSVNLSAGAAQTVTMTLVASTSALLSQPQPFHRNRPLETVFAGIFGLSLFGLGRKRRFSLRHSSRNFSRWMAALVLVAGLMAATVLSACSSGTPSSSGNGGGGSPTATSVTVTATSTNTTVTNNIQLTITP